MRSRAQYPSFMGQGSNLKDLIVSAVDAHDSRRAASELLDACNRGALRTDGELRQWLIGSVGKQRFGKLLAALVRQPCAYCSGGIDACANCGGSGIRDDIFCCRTCAGLGKSRCDFCGGSGLATYNYFPDGLRFDVLRGRVQLAAINLDRLHLGPSISPDVSSLENRILNLNKILSVLENARVEASRLLHPRSANESAIAIRTQIDGAAGKALDARRSAIVLVKDLLRRQSNVSAGIDSRPAAVRADFYEQLLEESSFNGTILDHPFLDSRHDA